MLPMIIQQIKSIVNTLYGLLIKMKYISHKTTKQKQIPVTLSVTRPLPEQATDSDVPESVWDSKNSSWTFILKKQSSQCAVDVLWF